MAGTRIGRPPEPAGRIITLDILRGLAVLGMILAHCHKMLAAVPASLSENPIGWFTLRFVAEKDRAIFAFLFGVSFVVMMRSLEKRGLPVTPIFLRRLLVLYLIGFAVELLTRFHILREYALWGVALLFLRNYPTRTLLVVAALSAAAFSIRDLTDSSLAVATHGFDTTVAEETVSQHQWSEAQRQRDELLVSSDYAAVIQTRLSFMLGDLVSMQRLTPGIYLALFIFGLLAVRHGIFSQTLQHRRLLLAASALGALCWVAGWWLLPLLPDAWPTPRIAFRLQSGLGLLDEQFLAFTWIGLITLGLAYRPGWSTTMAPLGWVGRMALTNYVLHAAIIEFCCAAYGLNLRLGPLAELTGAVLLFGLLAVFSRLWLGRFRYGPLEWVWRSLTYWQPQPMRLARSGTG